MQLHSVIELFTDLPEAELTSWIERGWVEPESGVSGVVFHTIDVARVRLIHDLRHDMDIGEDMIPTVLSLLDQVYELRATLKILLRALEQEPPDLHARVLAALGHNKPSA
jgi:chaperone modulatory protein CbpM